MVVSPEVAAAFQVAAAAVEGANLVPGVGVCSLSEIGGFVELRADVHEAPLEFRHTLH